MRDDIKFQSLAVYLKILLLIVYSIIGITNYIVPKFSRPKTIPRAMYNQNQIKKV